MGRLNIVCVDFCEFSKNALEWYLENYHKEDDTIGFVHVHQMPIYPSGFGVMGYGGPQMIEAYYQKVDETVQEAKNLLHRYKAKIEEKKFQCRCFLVDSAQSPGQTICQVAKEEKAAVIFMGQRGLGTFSRMLLGSVSDYVLHHSHVPVVVVPSEKKE